MQNNLAYIVSRFPHLPETFILRELVEMKHLGWSISLYPIVKQKQKVTHMDALHWIPNIRSSPFISLSVVAANWQLFLESPRKYIYSWITMIRENFSNFNFFCRALILFPKAVWMAKQIRKEGIIHVHAHYASHPALAAWIIYKLTDIPYSITVHAHDIFVRKTMLPRKIHDAEFIIAISEFNREYLAKEIGDWVKDKTHVVYCGIFPEFYEKVVERKDISFETYPDHVVPPVEEINSLFKIVNIGSLQPYKGQSFLIEACKILKERGFPFQCQIVGEGVLQKQLKELIHLYHLEGSIELVGPKSQEEIAVILKNADCYVQPSITTSTGKMEGIPVSIMEAMVCSVSVIATSISGVPELVKNQLTGLLVPPENVNALTNAIEAVFRNPQNAKSMASNGRELVLRQFNLHHNVQQLSSLMKSSTQSYVNENL